MRVVVKTENANSDILELLNERSEEKIAFNLHRGMVVKLQDGGQPTAVPKEILEMSPSYLIEIYEEGGAKTNSGESTIVCAMSGKRLKPYYTPVKGELACGRQAWFSVESGVVTVTGYTMAETVELQRHEIIVQNVIPPVVSIKTINVWKGYRNELPGMFSIYKEAVHAAYEKAQCYHCKCIHYATLNEKMKNVRALNNLQHIEATSP
jgi:hypothetical protein